MALTRILRSLRSVMKVHSKDGTAALGALYTLNAGGPGASMSLSTPLHRLPLSCVLNGLKTRSQPPSKLKIDMFITSIGSCRSRRRRKIRRHFR
jgi:hypothetical protein